MHSRASSRGAKRFGEATVHGYVLTFRGTTFGGHKIKGHLM